MPSSAIVSAMQVAAAILLFQAFVVPDFSKHEAEPAAGFTFSSRPVPDADGTRSEPALGLEAGVLGQKSIVVPYWAMVGADVSFQRWSPRIYGEAGVYVLGLGVQGTAAGVRPHAFIGLPIPISMTRGKGNHGLMFYATPFLRVPLTGGPTEFGVGVKCVLPWMWRLD